MHKFQCVLSSHRRLREKHYPILFSSQADGAFPQMHFLHVQHEFLIGKHLHSLLTHVAQPLMPQFSDCVGVNPLSNTLPIMTSFGNRLKVAVDRGEECVVRKDHTSEVTFVRIEQG